MNTRQSISYEALGQVQLRRRALQIEKIEKQCNI